MAYSPLAPARSSRRRRRLAIALVLAALFGLIALAVRYRTEERIARDYLAIAKEVTDDQELMAGRLGELLASFGALERQDILERINVLRDDSKARLDELTGAEIVSSVGEAQAFLSVAAMSWVDALDGLDDAIVAILDEPADSPTGESMLARSFELLRVGDRAYEGFESALAALGPDLVTLRYAHVAYATGDNAVVFDAELIANRLRLIGGLAGDHDVAISVRLDPEPVSTLNDIPVVPDSAAFTVEVVVTNEGNLGQEAITVSLELLSRKPGAEPFPVEQFVAFLEPGEAVALRFEDLPTDPGEIHELRVKALIAEDDGFPEDNTLEMLFVRKAP